MLEKSTSALGTVEAETLLQEEVTHASHSSVDMQSQSIQYELGRYSPNRDFEQGEGVESA